MESTMSDKKQNRKDVSNIDNKKTKTLDDRRWKSTRTRFNRGIRGIRWTSHIISWKPYDRKQSG